MAIKTGPRPAPPFPSELSLRLYREPGPPEHVHRIPSGANRRPVAITWDGGVYLAQGVGPGPADHNYIRCTEVGETVRANDVLRLEPDASEALIVPQIESAIDLVHEATGTRREFVKVTFEYDNGWYWTVRTHVVTYRKPKGGTGRGKMDCNGIGSSPLVAAVECSDRVRWAVEGGHAITSGGRIEVAS